MRLYIMRHGYAEEGLGKTDSQRELNTKGLMRVKTAAKLLKNLGINPTHIYSSPRVRAYQTAEIVAQALGKVVEIEDAVNFDFDHNAVKQLAQNEDVYAELMFVGHNPSMTEVIQDITGANIIMKPGGLARIDIYDQPRMLGQLSWLIAPKVFDSLGKGK